MVKLKGFQKLTSIEQALSTWLSALQIHMPQATIVPIQQGLGRILAQDLLANEDLPRFDKSAVDGYAVKAVDLTGASQFKPVKLQLIPASQVDASQAKQVWTGNPIPTGADAVIMLENTKVENGVLEVWSQLAPGDNVSKRGEDVREGQLAIRAGKRINSYHIGLAAALGNTNLPVYRKVKVAVLATGNELAELGTQRLPNQIYDSNKTMLSAMLEELGAETTELGIAKDNLEEISQKIHQALKSNDAVITTGGTSVGGLDLVPDAVNMLGKPGVLVHGVALRPAMPTALAALDGKPVLILSGNPVAAVIGFEVFGRPLICKLLGLRKTETRPTVDAVLTRRFVSALGRKTYARVLVREKNGQLVAEPISAKGSGSLSTLTESNGYVVVSEKREGVSQGETVKVHMFAPVEDEESI